MTKGIKNPGLGGTPYRDDDSMLFEMLGVYRRPNLPRNPDGPGPATPPNPGGNVPGGKSNSGGGGKSGGGKGKTPPGQMKSGGGSDSTTQMNFYYANVYKSGSSGTAGSAITGYTSSSSSATGVNTSTGVWTAPQTGPYLVVGNGLCTVISGTEAGFWLQKSTGGAYTTIHKTGYTHNNATGSSLGVSMAYIVVCNAGDTLRLWQQNDIIANVQWNISSLWTEEWFSATKATATGTPPDAIVGYDSKSEFGNLGTGYFDTSTGLFTCPANMAGRWVFLGGARPTTLDPTTPAQRLSIRRGTSEFLRSFNQYTTVGSFHTHNAMAVYPMAAGQTASLYQGGTVAKSQVHFQGFKLPDAAPYWSVYTNGDSASGAGTTYSGWLNIEHDGNFNLTTGLYTVPETGFYIRSATAYVKGGLGTQGQLSLGLDAGSNGFAYMDHANNTVFRSISPMNGVSATSGQTLSLKQTINHFTAGQFSGFRLLGKDS